jgi:hypothetical protein
MDTNERKRLNLTIAGEAFVLAMIVLSSLTFHTWREHWLRPSTLVWAVSVVVVALVWLRRWRHQRNR